MNLAMDQFEALNGYVRGDSQQDMVASSADNVISHADEQEIMEAQERWELDKLKKKYEAEKDLCE